MLGFEKKKKTRKHEWLLRTYNNYSTCRGTSKWPQISRCEFLTSFNIKESPHLLTEDSDATILPGVMKSFRFHNSDVGFLQLGCRISTTLQMWSCFHNFGVVFSQLGCQIFTNFSSDFQQLLWHLQVSVTGNGYFFFSDNYHGKRRSNDILGQFY